MIVLSGVGGQQWRQRPCFYFPDCPDGAVLHIGVVDFSAKRLPLTSDPIK